MDNLQHQRFELKYLVHETTAEAVRDFVGSYLALDSYSAAQPDFSYPVHSLYLDSDDFVFYWQTINGNKNRYKLRLRYYDDQPDAPVYFEIKRRINNAILKERGAVKRSAAEALLAGQLPEADQLVSDEPKQFMALENFCRLMQYYHARPKAHVAYRREAWLNPGDNSARVTLDRRIRFALEPAVFLQTKMDRPVPVFSNNVVLELKFTGRFPDWFGELVRCFNLWQCAAAKYVDGITASAETSPDLDVLTRQPLPEAETKRRKRHEILMKNQQTIEPVPA